MHLAFGIVSLVPKGGLQLDCLQLAHILRHRGHRVTIFTSNPSPQLEFRQGIYAGDIIIIYAYLYWQDVNDQER